MRELPRTGGGQRWIENSGDASTMSRLVSSVLFSFALLRTPQDSLRSGDSLSARGTSGERARERGSFPADETFVQGWQGFPSPRPSPHSFVMGRGGSGARVRALAAFVVHPADG